MIITGVTSPGVVAKQLVRFFGGNQENESINERGLLRPSNSYWKAKFLAADGLPYGSRVKGKNGRLKGKPLPLASVSLSSRYYDSDETEAVERAFCIIRAYEYINEAKE